MLVLEYVLVCIARNIIIACVINIKLRLNQQFAHI